MARLSSTVALFTVALFLVLAGVMGNFIAAGWNEFAARASLAGASLTRSAECRPPLCIACPMPGRGIVWPAEFHGRSRAERR